MTDDSIRELLEAGVHFGHQCKRWNPKMKKYIFGSRKGINIIDLNQTSTLFNKALDFARQLGENGGTLLFVATKKQARRVIVEEAGRCSMPYVTERWLGGAMTNFDTVKKSVARLKELQTMSADGTFDALFKKEVVKLEKELVKLERNLGGIQDMDRLPDAVFIVDTNNEKIALLEAVKLKIPIIAIVDTNCNPDNIEYIIPGNDDAVKSIRLVSSKLADALLGGKRDMEMKQETAAGEEESGDAPVTDNAGRALNKSAPAIKPEPIADNK